MNLSTLLRRRPLVLDGGMGTLLQRGGLAPGEYPERWNLTHPALVQRIHRDYLEAGADILCTNTFGANPLKFSSEELEAIVAAAMENAKTARAALSGKREAFIALDIGPCGKLLRPYGELAFEDAVAMFAAVVRLGVRYGADAIWIETMSDSLETKAAVLAAKENSCLPVFVTNAYGADGKLLTGATPAAMVAMLEGLGVDALGANCSLGPTELLPVVKELLTYASVPVILKPNAGLPRMEGQQTVYDVSPEAFAASVAECVRMGVRLAGGCCGTTPDYIRALQAAMAPLPAVPVGPKPYTMVSSFARAVLLGEDPVLIGERINPTGKRRLKEALLGGDVDYILGEAVKQETLGAHILDVNVGLSDIDEPSVLQTIVCSLQAITPLPLQIDTADPVAMERAMRCYNGKPMINSVSGKEESMAAVFPLVKKYGGVVVALTLDEEGIPPTAAGRIAIAKRILRRASAYGIPKKDLVFDPLAMTVAADGAAPGVTLQTLRDLRRMGLHTSLGVSNISYGLPARGAVNSTFFAMALENGLSCAIMNPASAEMMHTYHAYRALRGLDAGCADYTRYASATAGEAAAPADATLQGAIAAGRAELAAELTKALLANTEPMAMIEEQIIPALDTVGQGFERGEVYLPRLLMSAEAAKAAFSLIRERVSAASVTAEKYTVVLATVRGDIHDIGKNIVKLLLENYGYAVVDLGRDVAPEAVVQAALAYDAKLVGLSALMTTTVPAMETTVRRLHEALPHCRVVVGGAVLTEEYAHRIGADAYGGDAMATVRYAESLL